MDKKKFLDANGTKLLYDKLVLGDYPNNKDLNVAIEAINRMISSKADSDSPTFTGSVKAPTPDNGVSDNTVATTEYVMRIATNQDATATAEDIVRGKTAYVGGVKLTGLLNVATVYISGEAPDDSQGEDGDICVLL